MNPSRLSTLQMPRHQSGVVLVISLILLLVLTILGITAASVTQLEEKMAGNLRDMNLAFQSAETALREAEDVLSAPALPLFNGSVAGLHPPRSTGWTGFDWATEARIATTVLSGLSEGPRFVIEELEPVQNRGGSLVLGFGAPSTQVFYRITARGLGATPTATYVLQSEFLR